MSHMNDGWNIVTGSTSSSRNTGTRQLHRQHRYASRWDDLPRTNEESRCASIRNTSNTKDQQWMNHNAHPVTTKPGQLSRRNHRWNEADKNISKKDDIWKQYRSLQILCYNYLQQNETLTSPALIHENPMYDLLDFMILHYTILPAEETAAVVVHDIFLPTLELLLASEERQQLQVRTDATLTRLSDGIVNVIQKLLLCNQHSSAMLSPITCIPTEDVSNGTLEELDCDCRTNYLNGTRQSNNGRNDNSTRMKLWFVLQLCLPTTVECFTTCVQATKRLDDNLTLPTGTREKRDTIDHGNVNNVYLDLPRVLTYFLDVFATKSVISDHICSSATMLQQKRRGLNLLLALLQYKPTNKVITSSVSFVQSIFFRNYVTRNNPCQQKVIDCKYCGWHHTHMQSSFLTILHDYPLHHQVASQCATQLLQSMPLSLWLSSGNKKPKKLSAFQQNLIDLLEDLTRIAFCQVKQQLLTTSKYDVNCKNVAVTGTFITAILTHVPYDDPNASLHRSNWSRYETYAVNLVDALMSQSLAYNMDNIYTPIVKECLRGHKTTTGPLQRTKFPIDLWMQREGRNFLQRVLSRSMLTLPSSSVLSLLYDILRSHPELVLKYPSTTDTPNWEDANLSPWSLLEMCLKQHTFTEPDMVAQCVERLLFGRQSFLKEIIKIQSTEFVSFDKLLAVMLPILESCIAGQNLSDYAQGLACSSVSCLLSEDWNMIIQLSSQPGTPFLDRMLILIEQILENCADTSISEELQVTCCKAIGNISASFIPSGISVEKYQMAHKMVMKFFMTLKQTLSQEYTLATRCMTMFAIGNLSHTIVTTPMIFNCFTEGDVDMFVELTDLCILEMSDLNDKLATNAVRTTGYMCALVMQCQYQHGSGVARQKEVLPRVIKIYVENIRSVIALESFETTVESRLRWKRRMAIRKQGWGSCNSLLFLLECNVLTQVKCTDDETTIEDVVSCFVECLESIHTIHEKVVLLVCSALRSIPDLSAFASDKLFGRVLVACCTFLFGEESTENTCQPKKKLYIEMELVLATLLPSCTETCILEALNAETFVSNLQQQFKWMVHQGCSPKTFQLFAKAFSVSGQVTDVNVEQQFINHFRSYESSIQSDLEDEL